MTRDEAIQKAWTHSPSLGVNQAPGIVEALVALGLIELDEPKDEKTKFFELCEGKIADRAIVHELWHEIQMSGLKIVGV